MNMSFRGASRHFPKLDLQGETVTNFRCSENFNNTIITQVTELSLFLITRASTHMLMNKQSNGACHHLTTDAL